MVTLLLPVGRTDVASGRGCPHLRLLSEQAGGDSDSPTHPHPSAGAPAPCCFGHRRLAELREIAASDCELHDPWAGATAYVRVRRLDWFYPHPFTVAGSVALGAKDAAATGCPRGLLIHITPERRWTLSLAKMEAQHAQKPHPPLPRSLPPLPHLGSAPFRLLRLLGARLMALGGSALPIGATGAPGRPATASGARASRIQTRRFRRLASLRRSALVLEATRTCPW